MISTVSIAGRDIKIGFGVLKGSGDGVVLGAFFDGPEYVVTVVQNRTWREGQSSSSFSETGLGSVGTSKSSHCSQ